MKTRVYMLVRRHAGQRIRLPGPMPVATCAKYVRCRANGKLTVADRDVAVVAADAHVRGADDFTRVDKLLNTMSRPTGNTGNRK